MQALVRGSSLTRLFVALLILAAFLAPTAAKPVAASSMLDRIAASGSVTGGRYVTIRIELTRPAYSGGVLVWLSSNSALIPVPGYVVVPGGEDQATLKIKTGTTRTTTVVTISAENGNVVKTKNITVMEPYLSSMSVQTVYRAGGQGRVSVRLSGAAPSGGIVVNLSSSNPGVLPLPSSVTVPAGAYGKRIDITLGMVETEEPVTITASYDGRTISKQSVVRNMS